MTDPALARRMWRTLEPYHAMIYFTPHGGEAYAALGVESAAGYFASRAAPMGAVSAAVVTATFFNFAPRLVEAAIPDAWLAAPPSALVDARLRAADRALRDIVGDEVGGAAMRDAAALARAAAEACPTEGRALCAANASLPWPVEPHLALWHAITILREFRGDGHVAALVLAGLDGCEALVTHTAMGDAVPRTVLQSTRGWSDDEWEAARRRLEARGLVAGDRLTATGTAQRRRIESQTDAAALAPWEALGEERGARLRELVRPFSRAVVASGVFGFAT